jgi:hypothetical protein
MATATQAPVHEERRRGDRRRSDRRNPGDLRDVSRIEHENLATEVMHNTRTLERIEAELRTLRVVVDSLQAHSGRR